MQIKEILSKKRSKIIKRWRDVIFDSYPDNSQRFLRKERDQFANPIGNVIYEEIEKIYDELVNEGDLDKITPGLEDIIRVRAVQDFKPSQAILFVLQLKKVIREEFKGRTLSDELSGELQALENRIDDIALLAFDIYSQCRQKIFDIRVHEVRNQVGKLLEKANLLYEIPALQKGL